MIDLKDFEKKLSALKEAVLIDNIKNNEMVDAYNQGIEALAMQISYYLKAVKEMKGEKKNV